MWKYCLAILFAMSAFCEEPKWSLGVYMGDGLGGKENLVGSFAVGYQVSTKNRVELEFNNDVLVNEDNADNHRSRVKSTDVIFVRQMRESHIRTQPFVGAGLGYGRFNVLPPGYWLDYYSGRNPTYDKKTAVHISALAGVETDLFNRLVVGAVMRHAFADNRHTTSVGLNFRVKI